jgi:hypothetical protein
LYFGNLVSRLTALTIFRYRAHRADDEMFGRVERSGTEQFARERLVEHIGAGTGGA